MRLLLTLSLTLAVLLGSTTVAWANEGERGGFGPCMASYYVGPRAGYQMNDGGEVRTLEIIEVFLPFIRVYDAYLAWDGQGWDEIVRKENLKK